MVKQKSFECKKCLYTTNHPFGLLLNDDGLCSGCLVHEEKNSINWSARLNELEKLIKPYKSRNGSHDCVIHIDGTAHSYHIVHLSKNILGLNPLLVCFNSHYQSDIGIQNIQQLITSFDLNLYQFTLEPKVYKDLVKHSLQNYDSVLWPYLAGKTSLAYRIACKEKIPLVIHGGLQSMEQVGMFSHLDNIEYSRWYRKEHDLLGFDETDFLSSSDSIGEDTLISLSYPDDADLLSVGVRGIFLNNYFKWDPMLQNKEIEKFGFVQQFEKRTFDYHENAGCSVYFGVHDFLRQVKCGFSKVREHLSREIRFERISKAQAKEMYLKSIKSIPAFKIENFFKWLGVESQTRDWILKFAYGFEIDKSKTANNEVKELKELFTEYGNSPSTVSEEFKIFGKGI